METRAFVLVGHGGVPKDYPRERVLQLKRYEQLRRVRNEPPTLDEIRLERELREWPRTPENDPYQAGLEALAEQLRSLLAPARLEVAYNEFCAPSLEDVIASYAESGVAEVVVVPSMLTPGGSHSEVEIPESIERALDRHPSLIIRYAWPFDMARVAAMLAAHVVVEST